MCHRVTLAAFVLCIPQSLSAQSDADKVRILAWYARLVANSALTPYKIVFALPDSAPDNPKLERQLPVLRLALQQAGVPTTPQTVRAPGRDTIRILLGIPERDSITAELAHYTLYSSQTDGTARGESQIYVSRLLCSLQQCFFLSQSAVGSAALVKPVRVQRLPPNKPLLQTPQTLVEGAHALRHVRQS